MKFNIRLYCITINLLYKISNFTRLWIKNTSDIWHAYYFGQTIRIL